MQISLEDANHKVQDAQDIYEIIQKIFYHKKGELDLHKEHFWVFALNKGLKILAIELVSIGSKDTVIADPSEVFRIPLYKAASAIILTHNHPSGLLKPSNADIENTNRLMKAGDILNIKVIENVIVTEKSYFSFRDNGLIEKLDFSTDYALSYIYEKKMKRKMEALKKEIDKEGKKRELKGLTEGKQKGEKIGLEKGAKKREVEIAKSLLLQGIGTKVIAQSTGISPQWLGRLKSELEANNY